MIRVTRRKLKQMQFLKTAISRLPFINVYIHYKGDPVNKQLTNLKNFAEEAADPHLLRGFTNLEEVEKMERAKGFEPSTLTLAT